VTTTHAQTPATEPLAEVNGDRITGKEVERALGVRLSKLEEQIYQLKRQALDALIARRLLAQEAAKRGISVAALLDSEVTAKVEPVTEQDIDAYYQANKQRLTGSDATVRQNVRGLLQQQKVTDRRQLFVASLREQATIRVNLEPPPVVRMVVSAVGAPVRGAAEAPVTLVEFSDFHCPFCKRAAERERNNERSGAYGSPVWVTDKEIASLSWFVGELSPSSASVVSLDAFRELDVRGVPGLYLIDAQNRLRWVGPYRGDESVSELSHRCSAPLPRASSSWRWPGRRMPSPPSRATTWRGSPTRTTRP
jgi:hypothetical protein